MSDSRVRPSWASRILAVAAIVVLVALAAGALSVTSQLLRVGGSALADVDPLQARTEVVAQIERGELSIQPFEGRSGGRVRLPSEYRLLTLDGYAYLGFGPRLAVAFPVGLGILDNWQGYVYRPSDPPKVGEADEFLDSIYVSVRPLDSPGWYYVIAS